MVADLSEVGKKHKGHLRVRLCPDTGQLLFLSAFSLSQAHRGPRPGTQSADSKAATRIASIPYHQDEASLAQGPQESRGGDRVSPPRGSRRYGQPPHSSKSVPLSPPISIPRVPFNMQALSYHPLVSHLPFPVSRLPIVDDPCCISLPLPLPLFHHHTLTLASTHDASLCPL